MSRDGDVSGGESQLRLTLPRDYTLLRTFQKLPLREQGRHKNEYRDTRRNGNTWNLIEGL